MNSPKHTPKRQAHPSNTASHGLNAAVKPARTKMTEGRFRLAFENAPIGMAVVDLDHRLRRVNKALCEALGYTTAELVDRRFADITHADDIKKDLKLAEKLLREEIPSYRIEKRFIKKDGSLAWLDLTAVLIRDESGKPIYGLTMVENITDRKRVEQALRTSEERYRSFVVNSSEGIWRLDFEQPIDIKLPTEEQISLFYKYGYLAECNDAMARMHGHERADDIVGLRFGDARFTSHPTNTGVVRRLIANNYRLLDLQTEGFQSTGTFSYFSTNLIGIVVNGFLLRIWGVQRDQTELRTTALKLEHSHQQLRSLSGHLQALREREKAHLAREIHDTIGQSLTSTKIELALLKKRLTAPEGFDLNDASNRLDEIGTSLEETLNCVKAISTELRPGVLDKFGLAAAIEWQCEEFSRRMDIKCSCDVPQEELVLSTEVSTALFRILQEALTNVARHAQAKSARVELKVDNSKVSLEVTDDGKGISNEEIKSPISLGLLGMRERVEFLKGSFSISGHRGKGTTVRATFPLKSEIITESTGDNGG
jgi:PAS domain S-box-containing protein